MVSLGGQPRRPAQACARELGRERWRHQVGEAAVTSSVSSRMPLREDRKVLSTPKPWSPAAAPSSGGRSRRSQALNMSVRLTGRRPPLTRQPRKGNRNLVGAADSSAVKLGPAVGLWEKAVPRGGSPRWAPPAAQSASALACRALRRHGEGVRERWLTLLFLQSNPSWRRREGTGRGRDGGKTRGVWG